MTHLLSTITQEIEALPDRTVYGRVTAVQGMLVEVGGVDRHLSIGARATVTNRKHAKVPCEVVGFRNGQALMMPFGALEDVGLGCRVIVDSGASSTICPSDGWLGRTINALGESVDGRGVLTQGPTPRPIRAAPPSAHARGRVGPRLDLGVRVMNTFTTCCRGQRMGIFAGSGVGKSSLMSMLARFAEADVFVIGLIGERGREVQEFIEDDLGAEGLARSVLVVATSDESPLMRRQAAYTTIAVAEHFRDQGLHVLCMMDSITRFAMAQREIGLSSGEPPTTKGYPPTVFAELPKLLERAGPGLSASNAPTGVQGDITGLFTVLVDGDDHNEPIADAVRGILDGHIVLERGIAERGRYPAINVLRSVSRTMPGCNTEWERGVIAQARQYLSTFDDMAEMIRLGAYRKGSDPLVDAAMRYQPMIESFMSQRKSDHANLDEGYRKLAEILDMPGEQVVAA